MGERERMITIKIPLTSATIDGDKGTIELPMNDVMAAIQETAEDEERFFWDEHRCSVCGRECVRLNIAIGQRVYIETPRCPHCGVLLMKAGEEHVKTIYEGF